MVADPSPARARANALAEEAMSGAPVGVQLDLAAVVMRLKLIKRATPTSTLGRVLLSQVLDHDLPRLESHVSAETRDWFAHFGVPWASSTE